MSDLIQASSRDIDGPLLELRDVTTHFKTARGLVRAVDGVSFNLDRGKALGIVGESGSGKTTMGRCLMRVYQPTGGQMSYRRADGSVVDLVAAALGLSGIDAVGGNVETECAIDPGLRVVVDRHCALQILVNLLDNARAAVGETATPRVTIRGSAHDGRAVIEVADNGHGIPAEIVDRVFTRGFTTKPHGHGFGLHGSFALGTDLG